MVYKVIDIQGVGESYAKKLNDCGIETVPQLLERGKDPKGRKAIEEATGILGKFILTWVNHADLFRVRGVGPQFAELLEAAGVDTVKELATRKAENLKAKMEEVNKEKRLTKVVPTAARLQDMISYAKNLEPAVLY